MRERRRVGAIGEWQQRGLHRRRLAVSGYQFGGTAASCNSTNAGIVQYTGGGVLEACTGNSTNGYSWIPIDSGMHYIGNAIASTTTALQFDSANGNWSANYNTLFLNCSGLLISAANNNVALIVGEGAGPTWETGAHYSQEPDDVTTGADIFDVMGNLNTATDGFSFYFYIYNPGSSTLHKNFVGQVLLKESGGWAAGGIEAFWNNDTNPLTGLEIFGGVAIKSGTCSLYGMN